MAKIFRHQTVQDWANAHPNASVPDLLAFLQQEADEAREAVIEAGMAEGLSRERATATLYLMDYRERH